MISYPRKQIYLLCDERMYKHKPFSERPKQDAPVERPERAIALKKRLDEIDRRLTNEHMKYMLNSSASEMVSRIELPKLLPSQYSSFVKIKCSPATEQDITLVHSEEYYYSVKETETFSKKELEKRNEEDSDIYYSNDTFLAATLAAGGTIKCVDSVFGNISKRAIAIVRPPSHHARYDEAMGKQPIVFFKLSLIKI